MTQQDISSPGGSWNASTITPSAREKPKSRGATLDLDLTDKEWLVGKGSLSCSDRELVQSEILGVVRRVHSKLTALHFSRVGFVVFK